MVVPASVPQAKAESVAVGKKQRHPNSIILELWLQNNDRNLYPSRIEKERLGEEAQMSYNQVARWFANRRRKLKIRSVTSPTSSSSSGGERPTEPTPEPPAPTPAFNPINWTQDGRVEMNLDSNNNPNRPLCLPHNSVTPPARGMMEKPPLNYNPPPPPLPHPHHNPFLLMGLNSLLAPYWWGMLEGGDGGAKPWTTPHNPQKEFVRPTPDSILMEHIADLKEKESVAVSVLASFSYQRRQDDVIMAKS